MAEENENNDQLLGQNSDPGPGVGPQGIDSETGDPNQDMGDMLGGGGGGGLGGDMGMGGGMDGGMGGDGSNRRKADTHPRKSFLVRSVDRLLNLIGVTFPSNVPKLSPQRTQQLNQYTLKELRHLKGFSKQDQDLGKTMPGELSEYLTMSHRSAESWLREAKCLRLLNPEIDAAAKIMVSTIISPNDMQTQAVGVVLSETDLGEEIEQQISNYLTDYFAKDYELAPKLNKWLINALYNTGATPLLTLPRANLDILNKAIDADDYENGIDPMANALTETDLRKHRDINQTNITKQPQLFSGEQLTAQWQQQYSCEAVIPDLQSLQGYQREQLDELMDTVSLESVDVIQQQLHRFGDKIHFNSQELIGSTKQVVQGLASFIAGNQSHVFITTNPKLLQDGLSRIDSKSEKLKKEIERNFLFDKVSPALLIDEHTEPDEDANVSVLELPYQCVIPVVIPGTPDQHICYFVMVDKWGTPLMDNAWDHDPSSGPRKLSEQNMQAAFGFPVGDLFGSGGMTDEQRFEATSTMFSLMFKSLLEHKLENYGLGGSRIEQNEAFTNCIFRQLLKKKKVGLVCVPASMMTYIAFNYHEDGTGKSVLEDNRTLFALRTTLMVAGVMAGTENSIDNKTIEIAVDEKNANITQMLEQVRNAYTEKKMLRFDNNPHTIQRDIIQKSLTIIPKGIRGLSDSLSVNTDHRQTGAIGPDDSLLEKLSNLAINALEVPASALNQTSENEYARSVATTNLFFNNNIKSKQKQTIKLMDSFLQRYVRYSKPLLKGIERILRSSLETEEELDKEKRQEKSHEDKSNEALENIQQAIEAGNDEAKQHDGKLKAKVQKFTQSLKQSDNEAAAGEADPMSNDPMATEGEDTEDDETKAKQKREARNKREEKRAEEEYDEYQEREEKRSPAPKNPEKIKLNHDSVAKNLQKILTKIHLSLPAPRVVVDKAQNQEIQEFLGTIDQVLGNVFNEEMLMGQGDYSATLGGLKALIRAEMTRAYVQQVGIQSIYDMPDIKQVDISKAKELLMFAMNTKKAFSNMEQQIGVKLNGEEGGGGFGGDAGMGGGMDMGMGGDMDMGGGGVSAAGSGMDMSPTTDANDLNF